MVNKITDKATLDIRVAFRLEVFQAAGDLLVADLHLDEVLIRFHVDDVPVSDRSQRAALSASGETWRMMEPKQPPDIRESVTRR